MTDAVFLSSPWLDAIAPDIVIQRPFRALSPIFLTVIAVGDDLTDMVLDLQASAWSMATMLAAAEGRALKGIAFASEELTLSVPEADQPIPMQALLMRSSFKGELSQTETLALFPFVAFEAFGAAIDLADARRRMQTASQAARRIRL